MCFRLEQTILKTILQNVLLNIVLNINFDIEQGKRKKCLKALKGYRTAPDSGVHKFFRGI